MLKAYYTTKIKRDIKLLKKRGYKFEKFANVVDMLINEQILPEKFHDHQLGGDYKGCRECHIEPDWLLIYKIEKEKFPL